MSETIKNRRRGGRIHVEHSAPVSHELPVLEQVPLAAPPFGSFDSNLPGEEPSDGLQDREQSVVAAYRRGLEEGILEGERRARAATTARHERDQANAAALAAAINEQFLRYAERLEQEAFRFALGVAGKILRRTIALEDDVVLRNVKEAFHRVVGAESVTLRINPEDEPLLRGHKNDMLASSDGVRDVVLEPDETVERGGCIIESPSGNIDARITTQMAQIESALFGVGRTTGTNG